MLLIELPDVVFETILSKLSYDEIARNRLVCKHFDLTCQKLLNRGFQSMERYHTQCLREVKSQLPRRESERRNHSLARHCDVLTAIETRISMLSMTFMKYINQNLCCFIPGKVIDEIFRILHLVKDSNSLPRAHEILQELRDISSMAMEHFDEKIMPAFKSRMNSSSISSVSSYDLPGGSLMIPYSPTSSHGTSRSPSIILGRYHPHTADKLEQQFKKLVCKTRKNKLSFMAIRSKLSKMRLRMKRQGAQMRLQSNKLHEQAKKLNEQELQIADLRRHFEEWEQKMGDLTAELSRARDESLTADNIKRRISTVQKDSCDNSKPNSKKRKLIVERKPSCDASDIKFKKFMSDLLSESRKE
ncbi:GSCOCG00006261001-RA-CDS [Cotesia congregata]|uniref:Similar to FBXO28: F-box only protein 28 (Homo sapiens) n=1 Tax=Cotesia congregata TaxID=51543 RepID=A0A8J2HG81_COTCN|nr:GSCOCG00006261001-RA-CDS [Cotesia congregata]CAG5093731.1 Similar to FBXO28: F-box only protein 28 (Homo sapiens) [Cotesia congregata]